MRKRGPGEANREEALAKMRAFYHVDAGGRGEECARALADVIAAHSEVCVLACWWSAHQSSSC